MDLKRIKSLLPLVGGTGIGVLIAKLFLSSPIPAVPNPELRVDLQNGLVIIPGDLQKSATSIHYTIQVDGTTLENTISSSDSIKLDFLWSENLQTIQLDYLNEKGKTLSTYTTRIGDGIIVDDIITISRRPKEEQVEQ